MIIDGFGKIGEMIAASIVMYLISGILGILCWLYFIPKGEVIAHFGEFAAIPRIFELMKKAETLDEKIYYYYQLLKLEARMPLVIVKFENASQNTKEVSGEKFKKKTFRGMLKKFLIDLTVSDKEPETPVTYYSNLAKLIIRNTKASSSSPKLTPSVLE
ncbi:hypothetical protein P8X24_07500 [Pyrococcus kukulkanii]|uniref:hypothetical protein n=1 Tax=Pyrococcus kukulkanii TaxID=1609559 RepID=UPI0035666518